MLNMIKYRLFNIFSLHPCIRLVEWRTAHVYAVGRQAARDCHGGSFIFSLFTAVNKLSAIYSVQYTTYKMFRVSNLFEEAKKKYKINFTLKEHRDIVQHILDKKVQVQVYLPIKRRSFKETYVPGITKHIYKYIYIKYI